MRKIFGISSLPVSIITTPFKPVYTVMEKAKLPVAIDKFHSSGCNNVDKYVSKNKLNVVEKFRKNIVKIINKKKQVNNGNDNKQNIRKIEV